MIIPTLYSSGKRVGDHFSALNREILGPNSSKRIPDNTPAWGARSAAELNKAKASAKATKKVAIPKVGRASHVYQGGRMTSENTKGRRDATAIKREMRVMEEGIKLDAARPAPGPVLNDIEKERLAYNMTYKSNPPQEIEEMLQRKAKGENSVGTMRSPKREKEKKSDLVIAENLFDQVVDEIKEREEFLERMTKLGRRKEYEHGIKVEIGSRVKHLEQLDIIINRERNLLENENPVDT